MPREKKIQVYKIQELTGSAKEHAYALMSENSYGWQGEDKASLKAFCEYFLVKIKDWEYGYSGTNISFTMNCDDNITELTGVRLWKYLQKNKRQIISKIGECQFTGYCRDKDLLDPLAAFIKRPNLKTTYEDLMRDCLYSWLHACEKDWEYSMSEEAINETCDANEYEFDEYGRLAH